MNAPARPPRGELEEIRFSDGREAVVWLDDGRDPGELPGILGLPGGGPVIVVCGGADTLTGGALSRAADMLGPGVSGAAAASGAVVVDGGTSSGVMEIVGNARARRPDAVPVLVGVAPARAVSYGDVPGGDQVPLDRNHSHFVLADTGAWGGETGLLMALAGALAGARQPVMVLAGGGSVAAAEVLEAVRRRWPVFVIQGTGGLADAILQLLARSSPRRRLGSRRADPGRSPVSWPAAGRGDSAGLREIADGGDIRPVTGADPVQLARELSWELLDEPVLKAAWQDFATYDRLATRLRAAFTRFQASILLLGVTATLLALIYSEIRSPVLHWAVVAIPILISVLIALAGRHAVGQRWVMLRAAAEAVKAEIYRYRTRTGAYGGQLAHADRQRALADHIGAVETRLMQTEASSGQLTPYAGTLPPEMYGAGHDDDGLSRLGAGRYLQIRVSDQLTYYHGRVRRLSRRRNQLQLVAIAAGGAGALLAAAGADIWVGLTGGMAAAALAYLGYLQVDSTIVIYNQGAARLAGIDRRWRALSPGQQDPAAFTTLVADAEEVLATELSGWVQQMNDAMRELSARPEDRPADAAHAPVPAARQAPDR